MAQSIKLSGDKYWDASSIHTEIVTANWTATSSASTSTHLTETATLSKGKWIACIQFPVCSALMGARLNAPSGITTLKNTWYMQGASQQSEIRIFEVTTESAQVYLGSAQSGSVTFSSLDRGFLSFIKIGA